MTSNDAMFHNNEPLTEPQQYFLYVDKYTNGVTMAQTKNSTHW